MFFVNGTNDGAYPLDSYAKTYGLVKGERDFRITVNMRHGHESGWAPQEIGLFVDHHLNGSDPLPVVMKPRLNDGQVRTTVKSETSIASAQFHYTTGIEPINELEWVSAPAALEGDQIRFSGLPNDATLWFLTVTDDRGAIVSSEMTFSNEIN